MSIYDKENTSSEHSNADNRLNSVDLAALIVDALLCAEIVQADAVKRAIEIATEEIEARKALGDY